MKHIIYVSVAEFLENNGELEDERQLYDQSGKLFAAYFGKSDLKPPEILPNVVFDISGLGISTRDFSAELKRRGVLANGINATHMRMVTHMDVTREDCDAAIAVVSEAALQKSPVTATV